MTGLSFSVLVVALLVLAALAVSWLRQRDDRRRDDFQALAARRGWSLTMSKAALGRPATMRFAARSGPGWLAETRSQTSGDPASAQGRVTEWSCEEPRWEQGTLIVASSMPKGETAVAAQMLPRLDDMSGRRLLQRLTGRRLGPEANGIAVIDGPEALTVMATSSPKLRVDMADLARLLVDWRPARAGEEGLPVLILSPAGLRLRLRHEVRRADTMEAFIDLSLAVVRLVG